MKKNIFITIAVAVIAFFSSCSKESAEESTTHENVKPVVTQPIKSNKANLFVHYMPWFVAPKNGQGVWGWHWTMANRNPDRIDSSGKREIASHYYPLTGPYDSGDQTILDYQCLLMKYSGVDGVMVDWYGTQDKDDYSILLKNTEAIANAAAKAGLKFAVVYEDATLRHTSDPVGQLKRDLEYLKNNLFNKANYVQVDGKPLFMVFGPRQYKSGKGWNEALESINKNVFFVSLNYHTQNINNEGYNNSRGEFMWVEKYPNYDRARQFEFFIGGAMPGFHDFYTAGNAENSYATHDSENGALFARQLEAFKNSGFNWLQISTWNDYGEGTTIEPTREYGYKYLTMLQQFSGMPYEEGDLKRIYRWYELSVQHPGNCKLQSAYYLLSSYQIDKADQLLNEVAENR